MERLDTSPSGDRQRDIRHDNGTGSNGLVLDLRITGCSIGGHTILGPFDFSLAEGETVIICGPSGVGKTTLLRILAGLETRFTGHYEVVPGRVSHVFQEPTLLPWRSAYRNMEIATRADPSLIRSLLDAVGLADKENLFPGQLSLGQRRRLALARAFANDPAVMFLDEPFVSLDPAMAEQLMRLFEDLRRDRQLSTVFVTHSEAEANRLGDRVLMMSGSPGRLTTADQSTAPEQGWNRDRA